MAIFVFMATILPRSRVRDIGGLTRSFCLLALLACAAPADARPSCKSGKTLFAQRGVRVFSTHDASHHTWYACARSSKRPTELATEADSGTTRPLRVLGLRSNRVVFTFSAAYEGYTTVVGWFDPRTRRVRHASLEWELDLRDADVAASGALALVLRDTEGITREYVAYVRRLASINYSGAPRLAIAGDGYRRGSLRLAADSVSWTYAGGTRTVPLAGETATCASGTTRFSAGGTRLFDVLTRKPARWHARACAPAANAPRTLAVAPAGDDVPFRAGTRAGTHIPFLFGDAVGTLDATGGALTATRVAPVLPFDVAAGDDGALAFAAERRAASGANAQSLVARVDAAGWTPPAGRRWPAPAIARVAASPSPTTTPAHS